MEKRPFENSADAIKENLEELKKINADVTLEHRTKKIQLRKMLKELSDGPWTIVEDCMIDVEVAMRTEILLNKRDKVPSAASMIRFTEEALQERFAGEPEVLEVIVSTIPNTNSVSLWFKKPEWKEEVEKRMRDKTLFSPENRASMINSLFISGSSGNTRAAEIWLKMSGDLNKDQNKDPVANMFEKIQQSLVKKK